MEFNGSIPKFFAKKSLKSVCNGIGGAYIAGTVVSYIIAIFLPQIIGTYIDNQDVSMWLTQFVYSLILFTLPFMIFAPCMKVKVTSISFKAPQKKHLLPYFLVGCGMVVVSNSVGGITTSIFNTIGFFDSESVLDVDYAENPFNILYAVLIAAVLPALVEEFANRGIVLNALKKYGSGTAIICSGAIFGIMHGTFGQIPFAFLFGMYLAFITIKSGTVWCAVILHFFNNFCATVIDVVGCYVSEDAYAVFTVFYFLILVFLMVAGLFISKGKDLFTLPEEENILSLKEGVKAFFGSATIIIFIIITALLMLVMQLVA